MTRKSPHKHTVDSHIRQGKRIEKYERGKGKKPKQAKKKKKPVVRESGVIKRVKQMTDKKLERKFKKYHLNIQYKDTSESVLTPGKDYPSATDKGMGKRKSDEPWTRITIKGVV